MTARHAAVARPLHQRRWACRALLADQEERAGGEEEDDDGGLGMQLRVKLALAESSGRLDLTDCQLKHLPRAVLGLGSALEVTQ